MTRPRLKNLSLNDKTETETANVWVSMTRPRLKKSESQKWDWAKDVNLDLDLNIFQNHKYRLNIKDKNNNILDITLLPTTNDTKTPSRLSMISDEGSHMSKWKTFLPNMDFGGWGHFHVFWTKFSKRPSQSHVSTKILLETTYLWRRYLRKSVIGWQFDLSCHVQKHFCKYHP